MQHHRLVATAYQMITTSDIDSMACCEAAAMAMASPDAYAACKLDCAGPNR
jgi:hypothetical protein